MDISFADKALRKWANDEGLALKGMGKVRAALYRKRLTQLSVSTSLEDVRYLAGNFHELKNDRKGQWACDLDQPYRLIFTPQESPIPSNNHGQYLWSDINGVQILEIINYHKEK